MSKLMKTLELKVKEPFMNLFKIDEHVLSAVENNIMIKGYDESKPVTVWKDCNIVIDGHTRLKAAINLEMETIPVIEKKFKDEDSALRYALHHQRSRRSLDDSNILHLVEKLDKMYARGGDRRSIFATAKLDLFRDEDEAHESSREVTAKLIGTTAEKVSQCRHVLQNCYDKEVQAIRYGKETLHSVYKKSLASKRSEEQKLKENEIRWKKLQELKISKLSPVMGKSGLRKHAEAIENLDKLVLELFPNLDKRSSDVCKIRQIVESFKSNKDDFSIFCEQPPVQRFLGSSLVDDFIAVLKCFGYKILTPIDLKVIKEEKNEPAKKNRRVPPPHCNISRVHEVGFISKAERREMDRRSEEWVKRDIAEGLINID